MNELEKILEVNKISFVNNVEMSKISYLKTGGNSNIIIMPKSTAEVELSVKLLKAHNLNYKIIGATTNLLFLDNATYSCILSTVNLKGIEINSTKKELYVGSGEMLADLSRFALQNAIIGFEGFEGIPGMIGGAVFMNAGAYGYEIKNVLKRIEFVDENGNKRKLQKEELGLHYRNSIFREGKIKGVITLCVFEVKFGSQHMIESKMELFHAKRHKYQEFLYPNLGSMFSGSIYRELGKQDVIFKIVSMFYFLFNYKLKLFRRESPLNRKWINDIAVKRFNLKYIKQPFSCKNINCLVNRGQGTDEMLRFIDEVKLITKSQIPIENEIVEQF
ncbi:MAG: FAD-binding protein [Bacteroidales bacterium]|nr:FAD-binding protein [Bacteroidales bacterium]